MSNLKSENKELKETIDHVLTSLNKQVGILTTELYQTKERVTVLEKALLHIVNSLDEKKQKSLRSRIKQNTKS